MLTPSTGPLRGLVALLILPAIVMLLRGSSATIRWQSTVSDSEREFDLVIYGAYGYVGNFLTASLLGDRTPFLGMPPNMELNSEGGFVGGLRIGLAGRTMDKLIQLRDSYAEAGVDVSHVGLIVADSSDPSSLGRMAARTRLVMTTVADAPPVPDRTLNSVTQTPTSSGGSTGFPETSLVMQCLKHGTHLLDLDGYWLEGNEDVIRQLDAAGRATGAVYGPSCGEAVTLPDMTTFSAWLDLDRKPLRKSKVYSLSYNVVTSNEAAVETFLWEYWDAPLIAMSAAANGYGSSFEFKEVSSSNAAHDEYWVYNKMPSVREAARFVTIAEVEAEDGSKVTTVMHGGEIDYQETARIYLEHAISLLKDGVRAGTTGGVWTAAGGWGEPLLRRLTKIGLGVDVMDPKDKDAFKEALQGKAAFDEFIKNFGT